jgi:hypothetical protein
MELGPARLLAVALRPLTLPTASFLSCRADFMTRMGGWGRAQRCPSARPAGAPPRYAPATRRSCFSRLPQTTGR